jgi:class 3 adenylate cyclase
MNKEEANILLVDDDEDILLAAKFLLKKHFTRISTAGSQAAAGELLNRQRFDLALLDMNYSLGATSGQEGFDLLNQIRRRSPHTRVIMMTAYGDIDLAIRAIKEGAVDFIVKPWDNAKLVSTVLGALKMGMARNESDTGSGGEDLNTSSLYQTPFSEVERIFMFLDIKSSTSIAEQLGHLRYFELLNDFFKDITDPISRNKGHIYQYVGDEVVVSWDLENGLNEANCLNCFFDIVETMNELAQLYQEKYSLIPNFKAGMHFGKVTTGTVGTLKKEIIYTGDVLNTASRIEGLCNRHGVNLLLSKELIDRLPISNNFIPRRIGEINLRGKSTDIMLYTVDRQRSMAAGNQD